MAENLDPGRSEGAAPWRFHLCVHLGRDWTHIQRPDTFHMLSSEDNRGVFVMQLFQQSDDGRVAAMLKQIGDDVKHKQDRRPCQLGQSHV